MRTTKKITLSAMLVALGTVFMVLGGLVEVLDLSVCALASILVAFVYIEIGSPYTWLVWLCTSLSCFLIFPGKLLWLEYLTVFGIYPILKAYIEKLPRPLWLIIKLAFINAMLWVMIAVCEFVLGAPLFLDDRFWLRALAYVMVNVGFIAYDMFITVIIRLYFDKFRRRFRNLLK